MTELQKTMIFLIIGLLILSAIGVFSDSIKSLIQPLPLIGELGKLLIKKKGKMKKKIFSGTKYNVSMEVSDWIKDNIPDNQSEETQIIVEILDKQSPSTKTKLK